jgi:3-oxoacyl-[acyl-carrier protein] reductase
MATAAKRLAGKTILITGATGAIGGTLCRALAPLGCRLGLLGRKEPELQSLADELRQLGATAAWAAADLRDRAAVQNGIASLTQQLGPADVLIHNAGVGRVTQAASPNVDDVEEMLEVNYLGGVYAVEAVLPAMLSRRSGQLVAVSSLSSLRGMAWTAGYSASKAAFATFLESLRPALRRRGIAATTCYLGFVRTRMSDALPLNPKIWRIAPEYAVKHVLRAVARQKREAHIPWYDACAARFLRRLPAWLFDRVMATFGPLMVQGEY